MPQLKKIPSLVKGRSMAGHSAGGINKAGNADVALPVFLLRMPEDGSSKEKSVSVS